MRTERERHRQELAASNQPYALEVLDRTAAATGAELRYPSKTQGPDRLRLFLTGTPRRTSPPRRIELYGDTWLRRDGR